MLAAAKVLDGLFNPASMVRIGTPYFPKPKPCANVTPEYYNSARMFKDQGFVEWIMVDRWSPRPTTYKQGGAETTLTNCHDRSRELLVCQRCTTTVIIFCRNYSQHNRHNIGVSIQKSSREDRRSLE